MLEIENLYARRGGTSVLHGVSLRVDPGEMVALIGRNGMGKTTLLRSVLGLSEVTAGRIRLGGADVTATATHKIARRGVGVVPEGRGIFPSLRVSENLRMGLPDSRDVGRAMQRVYARFPLLRERQSDRAGGLSGGQQQLLAIGRALVSQPRLLLVDEFSEGIQPNIVEEIGALLRSLNEEGVAVLLVEQNARLALQISRRGYILEKGRVVAEGQSQQLLEDEQALSHHLVI